MSLKDKKHTIENEKLSPSQKIDGDKLRTYEGFENVDDEQAKFILEEIERFALILYKQIISE